MGSPYLLREAIELFESSVAQLKADPNNDDNWFYYCFAVRTMGEEQLLGQAFEDWTRMIEVSDQRDYLRAVFKRYDLKPACDWQIGYERGFQCGRRFPMPPETIKRWLGPNEERHVSHLYIWGEDGVGDIIRHVAYMKKLTDYTDRLTLVVPRKLISLFQCRLDVDVQYLAREDFVAGKGEKDERLVSSGSLDGWFWDKDDMPSFGHLKTTYKKREADNSGYFKVGICYRSMKAGAERNLHYMHPVELKNLLAVPNCSFVSLQYDDDQEENRMLENYGVRFLTELDMFNDIRDLADEIAELDLVISASTMIADLSSALDIPTWRFHTDHGRAPEARCSKGSPWYGENTTLYARSAISDWTALVEMMACDLRGLTSSLGQN